MATILTTYDFQELKTQLDSTIAEVEAIAEHLEKQKSSPSSESGSAERKPKLSETSPPTAAPKPTLRRVASGGESSTPQPKPRTIEQPDDQKSKEDSTNRVFLRQTSWASREQIATVGNDGLVVSDDDAPRRVSTSSLGATSNGGIFAKNRSLWERRSSQQNVAANVEGEDGGNAVRGGFRSNRDFWEQRVTMRQKQTPDLVLDLPVNTLSTSPGAATVSTTATSPASASAPIPKPRPRPSVDRLDSCFKISCSNATKRNHFNLSFIKRLLNYFAKQNILLMFFILNNNRRQIRLVQPFLSLA